MPHCNWSTNQFVCLVPHGPVVVARASEVEDVQMELTVRNNIDVDSSMLSRNRQFGEGKKYVYTAANNNERE